MRLLLYLSLLICLTSCKAQENIQKERVLTETVSLLNSYFNRFPENSESKFNSRIIYEYGNVPWADSLIPQQLWTIRNHDIKKKSDIIDFEALFDKKDVKHFHSTSKNFTAESWREILDHSNLVDSAANGTFLSSPAFDLDFEYAILYSEGQSSGYLILFKKENNQWIFLASGLVWIS